MLLEYRITLANFPAISSCRDIFLTAQDDFLEKEDVILPVHLRLSNREDIVQKECTEIGDMMPLPVLHTSLEIFYGGNVLCSSLLLVDFVGDTLRCRKSCPELVQIWILS